MTKQPTSTDLSQLQDWLRRALYEVLGGPMQGIQTHATAERLPNGRIRITTTAEYELGSQ